MRSKKREKVEDSRRGRVWRTPSRSYRPGVAYVARASRGQEVAQAPRAYVPPLLTRFEGDGRFYVAHRLALPQNAPATSYGAHTTGRVAPWSRLAMTCLGFPLRAVGGLCQGVNPTHSGFQPSGFMPAAPRTKTGRSGGCAFQAIRPGPPSWQPYKQKHHQTPGYPGRN